MDPHGWPTGALKRASASSDDDYDVLCEGAVVGRGYGRSPTATTKTARRRTAMRRRARPRWQRSTAAQTMAPAVTPIVTTCQFDRRNSLTAMLRGHLPAFERQTQDRQGACPRSAGEAIRFGRRGDRMA